MPYKTTKPKKSTPPPPTEVELQNLQKRFFMDRTDASVRDEFFLLMRRYARSLALKNIKRTNIYLPPERVDEICTDATLKIFEQYDKNPNWSINASFAGMLFWKVNEAMYGQADDEKTLSLNTPFDDDDSSGKEIMDLMSCSSTLPWRSNVCSNVDLTDSPENVMFGFLDISYDEVSSLVDEAYEILPYRTFMRFVPWLVLQFRKPKTRNIYQLFTKLFLGSREESAFDLLLLELYNRIAQHT